ncbi:MAG: DUF1925 domain-containing protein [Eggerthellaceae bacterium]|nr:DUF1925 domain-containing protein [Eggerthellaceae bacterium]MBR3181213.1 DUF1925 domain-containing protein [Eggerthellaceae bacterium]
MRASRCWLDCWHGAFSGLSLPTCRQQVFQ